MKRNIMLTALATGAMALAPVAAQAAQTHDKTEQATEMTKGEKKLAKALEGRVPGKPVRCLQLSRIQSSTVYDDTAIVYRVGGTLYVNRPRNGASSLDSNDILVIKTSLNQLCNVDTVQMHDTSGFMTGVVFLGEFVPYDKPAAKG